MNMRRVSHPTRSLTEIARSLEWSDLLSAAMLVVLLLVLLFLPEGLRLVMGEVQ